MDIYIPYVDDDDPEPRRVPLQDLTAEEQALLERMQTPEYRAVIDRIFEVGMPEEEENPL